MGGWGSARGENRGYETGTIAPVKGCRGKKIRLIPDPLVGLEDCRRIIHTPGVGRH